MTLFELHSAICSWSLVQRLPNGALLSVLTRFPQSEVPEPPGPGEYFLTETTTPVSLTSPAWTWKAGRWQAYDVKTYPPEVSTLGVLASTWPEGHQFTVAFKVEVPEQMTAFLRCLFSKEMVHGCTVERVDLVDATVLAAEHKNKVSKLLRELQEAWDGH